MNHVHSAPVGAALNEMSGDQWRETLTAIGRGLQKPAQFCLIGSAPAMMKGQDGRLTIDIDTLRRRSQFNEADMRQACEKAGVLLDPKTAAPDKPYIQLVDDSDGIVHVGKFKGTLPVMAEGNLTVEQVPWANIVASKLVRAAPRDITDVIHIAEQHGVSRADVLEVTRSFPRLVRENVEENLVYLDMARRKSPGLRPPTTTRVPACSAPGAVEM